MENSDLLFKEKYIKYKKDYLILKEQVSGWKGKKNPYFHTQYAMYIILDKSSYDSLKRKVLHVDLSINSINTELLGCGLKLMEGSDKITFITTHGKKVSNTRRQLRRLSNSVIDIERPEYRLEGANSEVISTIDEPYHFGSIYTYASFITKLSNDINTKLERLTLKDATELNDKKDSYVKINVVNKKPFTGIMIFKFSGTSCEFIESHTLEDATNDPLPPEPTEQDDIIIPTVGQFGDNKYKLMKDNTIFNLKHRFIKIKQ